MIVLSTVDETPRNYLNEEFLARSWQKFQVGNDNVPKGVDPIVWDHFISYKKTGDQIWFWEGENRAGYWISKNGRTIACISTTILKD